jgi:hypothetical protein
VRLGVLAVAALLLPASAQSADDGPTDTASRISRDLADPVSATWSLKLKNNLLFLDIHGHGHPPQYQLQFQPTLPVILNRRLKLIARPQFTLLDSVPYLSGSGALRRTTGVGDTVLDLVLSPRGGPWLLGLGPTFIFPTANLDETGQGKWQAGPAAVLGYRRARWLAGAIVRQWWSFAGAEDRRSTSQMHLQYIGQLFFAGGWSIGTAPTVKVDWRAASGQRVTFPFGPIAGKVFDFGGGFALKLELELLYVPVHPSEGEQFALQLYATPALPSPLRQPLFGER